MLVFEWDDRKAASNARKHGITFEYATQVFFDELRIEIADDESSQLEERWITIGLIAGLEILVVYTVRAKAIRLISAREADDEERRDYWRDR